MTPAAQPAATHEEPNPGLNVFRSAPNLLTLMRICLAPFLVAAILEGHYKLSFALFVAAGLTDALDGTLARLLKQRSMLGQYLDPVADKLLLSTLFLVLLYKGLMPVTVTVLVFGRDVGILLVVGSSLCGRGAAGISSQHLRQSQYPCPDRRGSGRPAASAHRRLLGSHLPESGRSTPPWRLPSSRACITRGWSRAAPARRPPMAPPRNKRASLAPRECFRSRPGMIFRSSRVFNLHIAKLF